MKKRTSHNQRGITLVELMIIVGILGVMVTLSAGDFSQWMRRTRFREMTRSVYNGLVLARAEAIRQGRMVQCNLGPERFEVFVDTDGDGELSPTDNILFSYPMVNDWFALRQGYKSMKFREGVSIESASGNYILFNSRGYSVDDTAAQNLREVTFEVVDAKLKYASRKPIEVSAAGSARIRH